MLFILLCILPDIHSKLITYTLYQTNDICQYNWEGSVCLPVFPFKQTNQPLLVQLNTKNQNQCPSQTLVYIRSRQCIYCPKNHLDIHCNHRRLRRMIPTNKEHLHRNSIAIIGISLLSLLIVGSLFTLVVIKRSQAHTNLLELLNTPSNIKLVNPIKSTQVKPPTPVHLTVPVKVSPMK